MTPKDWIRELEKMGLSQAEIGRLTGISQPTISRIAYSGQSPSWDNGEAIRELYDEKMTE